MKRDGHSPASGARLLVEPSPALPVVSLTVAFKTGSAEDPEGKEGLSRLTTRLMRRTGGGIPAEVLDEKIDSMGAAVGADVTHSTVSFQSTVISRSLGDLSATLADVIGAPSLSEEELARLKRETEAELVEARDNDRGLARKWFRYKLFNPHPYRRPVSGTIATVAAISREDVLGRFEALARRDDTAIVLAGDIDAERAGAIADRIQSALRSGTSARTDLPHPTVPSGRRLVLVDKPERTQTQVLIGGLGTHPQDEDHISLHVANTIFGGTFTARLMNEVRSKRGWSYGAYSALPYDRVRRGFSLWTFPKADDAASCIRLELDLLEAWVRDGVTKKELDWAKRYLIRSHAFTVDTAAKRAGLLLDEVLYDLPAGYHTDYVERVRSVTLESANEAVRRRISTRDLLFVVVGTASEIAGSIENAVPDLASTEIVPFDADA